MATLVEASTLAHVHLEANLVAAYLVRREESAHNERALWPIIIPSHTHSWALLPARSCRPCPR